MSCTYTGYGGLFGLKQGQDGINLYDPGTTAAQADASARILAGLVSSCGGSLSCALSHYSGGGYSSVPMGAPPDPSFTAAEQANGLPSGVLTGIWAIESGRKLPNPCVNDGVSSSNVCCGDGGAVSSGPLATVQSAVSGVSLGSLLPWALGLVALSVALPVIEEAV